MVLCHHMQLLLEISFEFRKCLLVSSNERCALHTFISKTLDLLQLSLSSNKRQLPDTSVHTTKNRCPPIVRNGLSIFKDIDTTKIEFFSFLWRCPLLEINHSIVLAEICFNVLDLSSSNLCVCKVTNNDYPQNCHGLRFLYWTQTYFKTEMLNK